MASILLDSNCWTFGVGIRKNKSIGEKRQKEKNCGKHVQIFKSTFTSRVIKKTKYYYFCDSSPPSLAIIHVSKYCTSLVKILF